MLCRCFSTWETSKHLNIGQSYNPRLVIINQTVSSWSQLNIGESYNPRFGWEIMMDDSHLSSISLSTPTPTRQHSSSVGCKSHLRYSNNVLACQFIVYRPWGKGPPREVSEWLPVSRSLVVDLSRLLARPTPDLIKVLAEETTHPWGKNWLDFNFWKHLLSKGGKRSGLKDVTFVANLDVHLGLLWSIECETSW